MSFPSLFPIRFPFTCLSHSTFCIIKDANPFFHHIFRPLSSIPFPSISPFLWFPFHMTSSTSSSPLFLLRHPDPLSHHITSIFLHCSYFQAPSLFRNRFVLLAPAILHQIRQSVCLCLLVVFNCFPRLTHNSSRLAFILSVLTFHNFSVLLPIPVILFKAFDQQYLKVSNTFSFYLTQHPSFLSLLLLLLPSFNPLREFCTKTA